MKSSPYFWARLALIALYLVVIAGSIVRVTGSGMGCPDWPKCFGHLIPPTNQEVLLATPGKSFEKGQMVIHHDTLWVAKQSVVIDDKGTFWNRGAEAQWKKYPKHDYAIFNVWHTWTEYINRLLTGVLGLPVLILLLVSLRWGRNKKGWIPFFGTLITVALIIYEAWLGKLVVDGHLTGSTVTLHMLGTMGIIFSLLWVLKASENPVKRWEVKYPMLLWISIAMVLIQIVLGTQLREVIDAVGKEGISRKDWIAHVIESSDNVVFYVHRTFSWLVLFTAGWLVLELNRQKSSLAFWIAVPLVGEFVVGIMLAYFNYPIASQPIHLLFSMILLGALLRLAFGKKTVVG
ncbi:MAG: hypothetical protein RL062_1415 [Bacteroidota bacterium]